MELTGSKRWFGTLGIGVGMLAMAVDFSIVNTAIPAIQEHFAATMASLQWIMTGLGVAMTALLVTMGRLADLYGRRRLYIWGLIIFALSSLLAGFAPAMIWLIIGRGLQGVAGAVILPISLSLMIHQFSASDKGKAIGCWTSVAGVGLAIGPVIGGLLVSFLNWRWIFFINPPIAVVSIAILLCTVSESRDESHKAHIDPLGVAFLIIGTGALALGIVEGPIWGWASPITFAFFGAAIAGFVALAFCERRADTPIIPFRLFLNRMFFVCASCNFGLIFCWWTVYFLLPLYLDNIQGTSPYQTGLILLALALPFIAISFATGHIASKTGPKWWLVGGYGVWVCTLLGMAQFREGTPLLWILLALFSAGVCFGVLFPSSTTFALSTLPKRLAGTASGSLTTLQELGGTLGVAVSGTVFRIVDEGKVFPALKTVGLELSRQDRATVRGLLSEPSAIQGKVEGLRGVSSSELLPLFREGFVDGFSAAMLLLAAVSAAVFLLTLLVLKKGKHAIVHPEDFVE